ncbi:hypothetical protein LO772_01445 [Yinghuangia sp. ASG 101]|uniref:DUF6668 family protein n=1 Tax=Yinghuangia sp. ASG 101 TaxID=2896848 RepID=UPI001E60840E|nr:DUF6668 family protein [Yinghuangia sp. ASG 101]UGQ12304.1 hypothetical protein LO772_01445 [Yinghuangia sp. ASG 101]
MKADGPPNPWLAARARDDHVAAPVVEAPSPGATAVRPQSALAAESPLEGLAFQAVALDAPNPPWWWVGCHGGAGVSTLASAVAGGRESTKAWPIPAKGNVSRVVLVARTNAPGLAMAQVAARQWAAGRVPGVTLLGLVAVADAPGRLPRQLAELLRLVAGGVPKAWFVPWIDALRFDRPLPGRLPKGLTALEAELTPLRVESGQPTSV